MSESERGRHGHDYMYALHGRISAVRGAGQVSITRLSVVHVWNCPAWRLHDECMMIFGQGKRTDSNARCGGAPISVLSLREEIHAQVLPRSADQHSDPLI